MSLDNNEDIESLKEDYESDEHWQLRRDFILKWKGKYDEDRLLCLARVYVNMELMGCRYPPEVMKEIAYLSEEVGKSYRQQKKTKLQRTFVSASDAAEDRAKGIKRKAGIVDPPKTTSIQFVAQGQSKEEEKESDDEVMIVEDKQPEDVKVKSDMRDVNNYLTEMKNVQCIDSRNFGEYMFHTVFGRLVLLIRPWTTKYGNIQASCSSCKITQTSTYENGVFTLYINNVKLASADGFNRAEARAKVENMAWDRLINECISVLIKEQWIADGDARITTDDVTGPKKKRDLEFGTPIESSVATKMMKLMGWSGGGLGADAQGISEPIKPHLQMVNRAGLGSSSSDINALRRSASTLMSRFHTSSLDVDLVFAADFSKEERALLHVLARKHGLASTSYGKGDDRFLVIKKKMDPFSLVRAVIENGGNTNKYQLFIPSRLKRGR